MAGGSQGATLGVGLWQLQASQPVSVYSQCPRHDLNLKHRPPLCNKKK
ncbi:unnamed protein product, partial [marine sediment metagenome]